MLSLILNFLILTSFASELDDVKILSDLLKIESVRSKEDQVVAYLSKVLDIEGIGHEVITHPKDPQKKMILATIGPVNQKGGVILMSHSDVVEAGKGWNTPAFGGVVKDKRVIGRGALDMKGAMVMHLLSFIKLSQNSEKLKRPLMFLVVPDEENGGGLGAKYLTENFQGLFEPFEYVLNEGGFGIKDFPKKGKNIITIQAFEKGILGLKLRTKRSSGHGSMPSLQSSMHSMLSFIEKLKTELGAPRVDPKVLPFLKTLGQMIGFPYSVIFDYVHYPFVFNLLKEKLMEKDSIRAMLQNTFSITSFHTEDLGPNVIPGEVEAYLDVRILPSVQVESFIDHLFEMAKRAGVEVEVIERSDSSSSSFDTPFFSALKSGLKKENTFVTPYLSPGATDNRFMRRLGLKAYGLIPVLIPLEEVKMLHGANESISIENLRFGEKFLTQTLENYLQ